MGHPVLWAQRGKMRGFFAALRMTSEDSTSSLGGQLAEDVGEDAAVLVVEDFLRGVDADGGGEFGGFAAVVFGEDGDDAAVGEFGIEHLAEQAGVIADGKDLFAAEA